MALMLAVALMVLLLRGAASTAGVIAAVKVVDPMITLGPYAMVAWAGLMGIIATNMGDRYPPAGAERGVVGDCCRYSRLGWILAPHALPGRQTPGKRPMWWREAVAAKFAWRNLSRMPAYQRSHQHPAGGEPAPDQAVLRARGLARSARPCPVQLQR